MRFCRDSAKQASLMALTAPKGHIVDLEIIVGLPGTGVRVDFRSYKAMSRLPLRSGSYPRVLRRPALPCVSMVLVYKRKNTIILLNNITYCHESSWGTY